MAPKHTSNAAAARDEWDDFVDGWDDDRLRPPSPGSKTKKRKADDGDLGITDEIDVKKKARAPLVKLDEQLLLSEKGIPKLRRKAKDLHFKGKSHEFSDGRRLLSFYQFWLDDLFPKAKFLDALAMVERLGHKSSIRKHRMDWIHEAEPKASVGADEPMADAEPALSNSQEPTGVAPMSERGPEGRPETPSSAQNDLFDDGNDLYDATPRAIRKTQPTASADAPDDEDLEALLQMESVAISGPSANSRKRDAASKKADGDDEGDFDAILAAHEAEDVLANHVLPATRVSTIFGRWQPQSRGPVVGAAAAASAANGTVDDEALLADDEAAMAEMEGLW